MGMMRSKSITDYYMTNVPKIVNNSKERMIKNKSLCKHLMGLRCFGKMSIATTPKTQQRANSPLPAWALNPACSKLDSAAGVVN